ncbi:MAG: adenylate/guanylate cyclase domain-containing protein [Pseudomonadota bacterium]
MKTRTLGLPRRDTPIEAHMGEGIIGWLIGEAPRLELGTIAEGLAQRLTVEGLPIDRFSLSFGLLNPSIVAVGLIWRPGQPLQYTHFGLENRDTGQYERSPFKRAQDTGEWVHIDLANTPDEAFGIVPSLREDGFSHYYAIPLPSSGGDVMSITMATKGPRDFSDDEKALLNSILPAAAVVLELKTLRATFRDVLSAYVGRGPAAQIIDGTVHRGEVTQVRAAIMVVDLRGFTHMSTQLPPRATAEVINAYYDVVVPQVVERGGEVLKFIGDAVLAIFPTEGRGEREAVLAALDAARAALDTDAPPYEAAGETFPIRFGVAVHVGEAVFGNVGSRDRLDFTVIGRDVNVAARIASLCSRLGRDYLVSDAVAAIGRDAGRLMTLEGGHDVRGLGDPLIVHVPDVATLPPAVDDGISQGLTLASNA